MDYGNYDLVAEFTGFRPYKICNINISKKENAKVVPAILLSPAASNLQRVTVRATQKLIDNRIDKWVSDAEADLTSQGDVALTANNFFSEYVNQVTLLSSSHFTTNSLHRIPFRSIGLNFTWRFGKLDFNTAEGENRDMPSPEL